MCIRDRFKGLLLGLFFISVGMAIDFGLLISQPGLLAMLLLGFLGLKLTTLWLTARVIGCLLYTSRCV